jgi:hypothetical protein
MTKISNEEKLLRQLIGMVESYDIAIDVLKESVAGGVVRGAFINEIEDARKLIKEITKGT